MWGGGAPLKPPIPNRKLFSLRFEKCNSFEFTVNGEALPPSYYAIETDIFIKVACCHVARLRELRQTGLQRIHENVAFTHVFKTNQIMSYFFWRGGNWGFIGAVSERGEECQYQQFLVRATFSSFSLPSHLEILVLPI